MKDGKRVLCLVLAGLLVTAASFAETKKLTRIGNYTVVRIRGNVPTQEVMKILVDRYAADFKQGFEMAGNGDLSLPFMEQVKAANFRDITVPVGGTFQWMLFRSGGKIKVARDLEWAGKQPLEVFGFDVKKDFETYHFIIPKPCGNVALTGVTKEIPLASCSLVVVPDRGNIGDPITIDMSGTKGAQSMTVEVYDAKGVKVATHELTPASPKWQTKFDAAGEYSFKAVAVNPAGVVSTNPCVAKTYVNFPPVCKLWTSCLPCEDYVGRPITFDASGSTDPDGQITKAIFTLTDEAGQVVETFTADKAPFVWERIFKKAGMYTIAVSVLDNAGATAPVSDACRLAFEVTQKRSYWFLAAGPLLAHGTYTTYGFLQGGWFHWLAPDQFALVLSAGGAIPTVGEPWKALFLADAMVEYHMGPAFLGAGLGFSTKEQVTRKSGLDLLGEAGVTVFNSYTSRGAVYFQIRSPLGSNRSFDDHHKFLLGFRLMF